MTDVLVHARNPTDAMGGGIYVRSGGSAANVAAWAQHAGWPAAWMGCVGDDTAGDMLLRELGTGGVTAFPHIVKGTESGVVISRISNTGNRSMQSARWAATHPLTQDQIGSLRQAHAIHLTGYMLTTTEGRRDFSEILSLLSGATISFDLSAAAIIRDLGPKAVFDLLKRRPPDVIFATTKEATALTSTSRAEPAARRLSDLAKIAVVKQGRSGCVLAVRGTAIHFHAAAANPVDSTGAGDAFAGTWLAHYLDGVDVSQAAALAAVAAADAIERIGGRPPVV